ncbi:hypothetical protein SAMN05660206_11438 [Sphingobacterium wenxiniae]|uniref:Uncharacterized protein n=1 Tax=Sphingobacterium wenxiniae TaxID=683125 RepID=A0A1I6VIP7_9SPHI|nr:hypothetical protein SAMN05660206_11438 [Sphingobacterium wenxiniae]
MQVICTIFLTKHTKCNNNIVFNPKDPHLMHEYSYIVIDDEIDLLMIDHIPGQKNRTTVPFRLFLDIQGGNEGGNRPIGLFHIF